MVNRVLFFPSYVFFPLPGPGCNTSSRLRDENLWTFRSLEVFCFPFIFITEISLLFNWKGFLVLYLEGTVLFFNLVHSPLS